MVGSNNLNNPTIVEGKQSGISNNSDLQTFSNNVNGGSLFVSDKVEKRMEKKDRIYKYIPIDHFLSSFHKKEIYLASPYKWDDPFEVKYIEMLKQKKDSGSMGELNVFATCFSCSTDNEEALWKVYTSSGDNFVRLAIKYSKLRDQLINNKQETYLTAINYQSRTNILKEKYIGNELYEKGLLEKELFLNNFSLKQNAYKYENEIRLCAFGKKDDYMLIHHFGWKDVIETITFPPYAKDNNRGLYDIYHYYLIEKLGFKDTQILMSRLYDKNKTRMQTKYKLKYELKYERWRL